LNRVVNVGQIISKLCFKQSLFNDLVLGVFFEGRVILIVFFVTNKEKKRDIRMEMFAKLMKRFNLHTPVTNVQAQI
jgi:hypothetical protein